MTWVKCLGCDPTRVWCRRPKKPEWVCEWVNVYNALFFFNLFGLYCVDRLFSSSGYNNYPTNAVSHTGKYCLVSIGDGMIYLCVWMAVKIFFTYLMATSPIVSRPDMRSPWEKPCTGSRSQVQMKKMTFWHYLQDTDKRKGVIMQILTSNKNVVNGDEQNEMRHDRYA